MRRRTTWAFALGLVLGAASTASAQMPIHFSFNGGMAAPLRNEADLYKTGIHAGVGVKIALVPLQIDGTFDRMAAKSATGKDLTVLAAGVTVPISITPPLLPVGVYLLAGGGLYRQKAETTSTDFGINGGVGVRASVPGIRVFVEARGVGILSEIERRTYATVAAGIRL